MFDRDDDPNNPYLSLGISPYATYKSVERGGVDQYDFNIAFNFNDRFYFGVTIGAYDVNYRKSYFYGEDMGKGDDYSISSENRINGAGWDAKFGFILRPMEDSPLRLGLAIHTPTFYKLTYTTRAAIQSNIWYVNNETGEEFQEHLSYSTYYELNDKDMKSEFELRTPWTYNLSIGYTVGSNLALGAEYEYQDYSKMAFYYPEGDKMEYESEEAKINNKGVSTFRIGAEYKVIPEFALRLGYNYSSAAFKNDAVKTLPYNSLNVDTDFANTKSLSNYTLGIGYRGSSFYADLAYKYSTQKADFYPFALPGNNGNYDVPAVTKVTNSRSQVLFTLGMRF